ncbi:AraC family transcriptional regulator [Streptomyces sp. HD]|uniref:AraC family transcriptional regulator n=1 Tax=Streptomyces sp. HD TaxID=3020892 RepID=UPI00232C9C78|nr:helix-turn-helix domain-containing protein [Streptomyces sp. HD]MDC0766274.1 helix-turn-helix domain-containing protein [Streptomyces sp. HD]
MTNTMSRQVLPTPEALRPWVAGIGSVSAGGDPAKPYVQLPDTATKVVFRVDEDGRGSTLVLGPRTRASYHRGKRFSSCLEMRLAPGTARPLLGVPAVDLVGHAVPLDELPGAVARQLARELRHIAPEQVVPHLTETLPDRLSAVADRSRTALLRAGADALSPRTGHAPGQVRDVARELAVSERQLRNLFAEGVGLSPKHYARIDRVHSVLDRADDVPWAQLAVASGYYDQAHMTSDFRTLMGVPPRSYFSGRLPEAQPCRLAARR